MDILGGALMLALIPFGIALLRHAALPWVPLILGLAGFASPVLWVGGLAWAVVA